MGEFLPDIVRGLRAVKVSERGDTAVLFICTREEFDKNLERILKNLDKERVYAIGPVITLNPGLYWVMLSVCSSKIKRLVVVRVKNYTGITGPGDYPKDFYKDPIVRALERGIYPNLERFLESQDIFLKDGGKPSKEDIIRLFQQREIVIYKKGVDIEKAGDIKELSNFIKSLGKIDKEVDIIELEVKQIEDILEFGEVQSSFHIIADDITEAYLKLMRIIELFGKKVNSAHGETKEVLNVFLSIKSGSLDESLLKILGESRESPEIYARSILLGEEREDSYSYGERIRKYFGIDQLERVVEILKKSKDTRRIVISLWDPKSDLGSKNPPCIVMIGLNERDKKMFPYCIIRSNDVGRAFIKNVYAVFKILEYIGDKICSRVSQLDVFIASAHVYSDSYNLFKKIHSLYDKYFGRNKMDNFSLRFSLEEKNILVEMYKDGKVIETLKFKLPNTLDEALKTGRKIIDYLGISNPYHTFYIGFEIARILKEGKEYVQM